jgi:hypothetical protein
VSIEELRLFLTSVIVRPPRARGVLGWLRLRPPETHRSDTVIITRSEIRPAPPGGGK